MPSEKQPPVDSMMKWHFYIGYSREDKARATELSQLIRSLGFVCTFRESPDVTEVSKLQNIKQGVTLSHKCLLLVTPEYMNDENSKLELIEAGRKVSYLGRNSVVALVESSVSKKKRKKKKLNQFSVISLEQNQTSFTKEFLDAHSVFSDLELKPMLSSIPSQNVAVGVAYAYYFGFLQGVLPVIIGALKNQLQQCPNECIVKKMLIIIPEDVICPPKIADNKTLKQMPSMIKMSADRCGIAKRDYTLPVFELSMPDGRRDTYYFVGDVPACLFALREAHDSDMINMTMDDLYQARNEFVFCVKAFLTHREKYRLYENQWEILMWPKEKENPNRKSLPEFLYEQIFTKRLTAEAQVSSTGPMQVTPDTFNMCVGVQHQHMYSDLPKYELRPENRGYCVIINNSKFPEGYAAERTGAPKENEMLEELFKRLHFRVTVRENLTDDGMIQLLQTFQAEFNSDESDCDAFVCFILSHGSLGYVASADGKRVAVMDLMDLFSETKCPALKGKPKMFFIEACQSDDRNSPNISVTSEAASVSTATSAPVDTSTSETRLANEAVPASKSDQAFSGESTASSPGIGVKIIPSSPDFIVSYATMPRQVAWADPSSGGVYVNALCKFLPSDLEIDFALRAVNLEVKRLLEDYSSIDDFRYTQETCHYISPPYKLLFLGGT